MEQGWKVFAVLSNFLGWAPGRLEAFLAPIAAYCTPYHLHMGWKGPECDFGCLSPSNSALACIPLSLRGRRGDRMASPSAVGCRIACWDPTPFPPPAPLPQLGSASGERLNYAAEFTAERGGGPCTA